MRGRVTQLVKPINSQLFNQHLHKLPPCTSTLGRTYTSTTDAREGVPQIAHRVNNYIYESNYQINEFPNSNIWSYIMDNQYDWAHKPALTCGITGRQYTYSQITDYSLRFGGLLRKINKIANLEEEQLTVAALMTNSPEWPVVFFGTVALGGKLSPINITYNPEETARHIENSGAQILVVDSVLEPVATAAKNILKKRGYEIQTIVNGKSNVGDPNLQDVITSSSVDMVDPIMVSADTTVFLPYSSGTSGVPKGVSLTHAALTNNIASFRDSVFSNTDYAIGNHQDISMGLLPFFHIYGSMAIVLVGMVYGSHTITLPKFDPQTYVAAMKKYKINTVHTVPSLLQFMAQSPAITKEHVMSVKTVTCGAAPVPPTFAEGLSSKTTHPLVFQEAYGMTETLCSHMTPVKNGILGSCGQLLPSARARVTDIETGEDLLPGEEGELLIQAPWLMTKYHNNEEATNSTLDEDGWIHTGDVAVVDEDGYFRIVDRIKELIKVKGVQVSPTEVEKHLLTHPGIAEVGIVGIPHERAGEVPKAYVVPRDKNLTKDDVISFVEKNLSRTKHLVGGVEFVESLPKNTQGKLLRRLLKELN